MTSIFEKKFLKSNQNIYTVMKEFVVIVHFIILNPRILYVRIHFLTHEVPKGPYGQRKDLTHEELLREFRGTWNCHRNVIFSPLNPELTEPQPLQEKTAKYCTK